MTLAFSGILWYTEPSSPCGEPHRDRSVWYASVSIEEVLRIKDVAALLKVGTKTVYTMAQNHELPGFKVRGQWRFSRSDIEEWIENQKRIQRSTDVLG